MPTLKELGYPFVFDSPWGVAGPKGMDPKVVAKLQDAFKKAMDDKVFKDALDKYDMIPNWMDAATYTKFVADYMVAGAGVVDQARTGEKVGGYARNSFRARSNSWNEGTRPWVTTASFCIAEPVDSPDARRIR